MNAQSRRRRPETAGADDRAGFVGAADLATEAQVNLATDRLAGRRAMPVGAHRLATAARAGGQTVCRGDEGEGGSYPCGRADQPGEGEGATVRGPGDVGDHGGCVGQGDGGVLGPQPGAG